MYTVGDVADDDVVTNGDRSSSLMDHESDGGQGNRAHGKMTSLQHRCNNPSLSLNGFSVSGFWLLMYNQLRLGCSV